jgi:histone deacetylase complex regulatory component SIN3
MRDKSPEPDDTDDDMRPEYDFSGWTGVRGKYYQKLRQGYTIQIQQADGTSLVQHVTRPEGTVTLDPDVREYFPDSESVNTALRTLIQLIPTKKAKRSSANASPKSTSS